MQQDITKNPDDYIDSSKEIHIWDAKKIAGQYAVEFSKQIFVLAAGAIILSITFLEKIYKAPFELDLLLLSLSWIVLTLSLLYGFKVFGGLIGAFLNASILRDFNTLGQDTENHAKKQRTLFFIGISLLIVFAGVHFGSEAVGIKATNPKKISSTKLNETISVSLVCPNEKINVIFPKDMNFSIDYKDKDNAIIIQRQ